MSSELASGPLPPDIEDAVLSIMREYGISNLTNKIMRLRLEGKYSIEFRSHKEALEQIINKLMELPEFQRELTMTAEKMSESRAVGGKQKSPTADLKKEKTGPGVKKQKKPDDYPKAALSAFLLFQRDNRSRIKEENPEVKSTDLVRMLGEMWNAASDAEKEKYRKLSEEDKVRHEHDLEEYLRKGGEKFGREKRGNSSAKPEGKPKRWLTSFAYFVGEFRKEHGEIGHKDVMKEAATAWKELSEEGKEPYKRMAQKDKERYEREMGL